MNSASVFFSPFSNLKTKAELRFRNALLLLFYNLKNARSPKELFYILQHTIIKHLQALIYFRLVTAVPEHSNFVTLLKDLLAINMYNVIMRHHLFLCIHF